MVRLDGSTDDQLMELHRQLQAIQSLVHRQQSQPADNIVKQNPRIAITVATKDALYPETGNTFPIIFLDGDYTPLPGDQPISWTYRQQFARHVVRHIGGEYIEENTILQTWEQNGLWWTSSGDIESESSDSSSSDSSSSSGSDSSSSSGSDSSSSSSASSSSGLSSSSSGSNSSSGGFDPSSGSDAEFCARVTACLEFLACDEPAAIAAPADYEATGPTSNTALTTSYADIAFDAVSPASGLDISGGHLTNVSGSSLTFRATVNVTATGTGSADHQLEVFGDVSADVGPVIRTTDTMTASASFLVTIPAAASVKLKSKEATGSDVVSVNADDVFLLLEGK